MSDEHFATPQQAEEAFYDAFARADLGAMARVWADDDAIVCVHPGGAHRRGRDAVLESWGRIFAGGAAMRFDIDGATFIQDALLAVHCVYENITHGPRLEHRAVVIATNVYRLTDGGWRMIVHHASQSEAAAEPEVVEREPQPPEPSRRLH